MRRSLLLIAVAAIVGGGIAAAAVIGGGAAAAQEDDGITAGEDRPMPRGLDDVLQRLVDQDVITPEQAEAVGDALREHAAQFRRPHRGYDARGRSARASLETVAAVLGIDEAALLEAFRDGMSIADVAAQEGVEVSAVVDALVAQHDGRIADAVADGKITEERAAELRAKLTERITRFVEGEVRLERKRFRGFRGFGDRAPRFGFYGEGAGAGV